MPKQKSKPPSLEAIDYSDFEFDVSNPEGLRHGSSSLSLKASRFLLQKFKRTYPAYTIGWQDLLLIVVATIANTGKPGVEKIYKACVQAHKEKPKKASRVEQMSLLDG